jgi:hypothetical protein
MDEYKRRDPKFATAFTDLITYVYSNLQSLLKKNNQMIPKAKTMADEHLDSPETKSFEQVK